MAEIPKNKYPLKDGSSVIIRTAMPKDAPALVKIKEDVAAEYIYSLKEPDEIKNSIRSEEKMIKEFKDSEGKLYIVAEHNGETIGYLEFDNFNVRKCMHNGLFSMYLAKDYRDKAIGYHLLNALIQWGESHPYLEKLSLYVFSDNQRARDLYERCGFVIEGICKKDMKMRDGSYIDSVLMTKFLNKNKS